MLCHITTPDAWAEAQHSGSYRMSTRDRTIDEVGYLHASDSLEQAARVGLFLYSDVTDGLLVLTLDRDQLTAAGLEVRCERMYPDDPTSEKFPHIYGGALPVSAVIDTAEFASIDELVRAAGLSMPIRG